VYGTGQPYEFPFLDYALNTPISIAPGEDYENSIIWNGNDYNDGHGHTFVGSNQTTSSSLESYSITHGIRGIPTHHHRTLSMPTTLIAP